MNYKVVLFISIHLKIFARYDFLKRLGNYMSNMHSSSMNIEGWV